MSNNIVNSAVTTFAPQADGRIAVKEQHSDLYGGPHYMEYLAAAGTTQASIQAGLPAHAQTISDQLNANEVASNVQNALLQIFPVMRFSTNADGIAALRAFYLTATSWDSVRMGNFIAGLNLSDASLESVFGVAAGAPLAALKTRLANDASTYAATIASVGQ